MAKMPGSALLGRKKSSESYSANFKLQPKQRDLLELIRDSPATWIGYGGSRGGAKAIRFDTPVPVLLTTHPSGFKPHGDLSPGDYVFDANGKPTRVMAVTSSAIENDSCEIIFNTGERISANADHLWVTMTKRERVQVTHRSEEFRGARRIKRPSRAKINSRKPWLKDVMTALNNSREYIYLDPPEGGIRTTEEIEMSLTVEDGREINHSIAVAAPLNLPETELPVNPYLLGLWLGDGDSGAGIIGMAESDMRQLLQFLPSPAWEQIKGPPIRKTPFMRVRFDGLVSNLRKAGVFHNKHIPPVYRRASIEQRRELLKGLLDSDGSCGKTGQITFCNTNERLIDDTLELINSLGIKAVKTTGEAKIYGEFISAVYRIKFVSGFKCFHLERKASRQKLDNFRPTTQRRYIVAVNRVEACEMKCITVEDPSGTYLVGRTFIPTHNSHAGRNILLGLLMETPNMRGCMLRRTYDLVRENHIDQLLGHLPWLRQFYKVGDKELALPNGSVLAFRHAENESDVLAMIGKQYRWFFVDQAEAFTPKELHTMKSCTRWPGVAASACKFVLMFNPGGSSHKFLKRIFFDRKYETHERSEEYAFVQAYGWDNVEWAREPLRSEGLTEEDYYGWDSDHRFEFFITKTQYGRELNALPKSMRVGWLLGRMDRFADQYYGDVFSPEPGGRHVRRVTPDPWNTRWLGIDWGYSHNSAVYWCSQISPEVTAFYREFVRSNLSSEMLAAEIVKRTPEEEREQIKHIFLSHDAFAKKDERDTIAQQMGTVFRLAGMPEPEMATMDVKGRAMLLYDLLGPQDPLSGIYKDPRIVIDPQCVGLIDVLPVICRQEDDPEKPEKFDGDDCFDGAVHCLTWRMKNISVPKEVLIRQEADKIADPLARWFYLRKHSQKKELPIVEVPNIMPWEAEVGG